MQTQQHRKPKNSVQDLISQLSNPQHARSYSNQMKMGKISKQNILEFTKTRPKWKDAGYKNSEFEQIKSIKTKMLSCWEIGRLGVPERSFKAPKGFKGFATVYCSNAFSEYPSSLKLGSQPQSRNKIEKPFKSIEQLSSSQKSLKFHRSKDTMFGFRGESMPKLIKI